MKILKNLDHILNALCKWVCIVTGSMVTLLIGINAVCRYMNIKFFGAEEIILLIAFWFYFIGSLLGSMRDTHINANMISVFTKDKKIINATNIIKVAISLVITVIISKWSYDYSLFIFTKHAKSNIFKFPVVIQFAPILISYVFWFIYLIRDFVVNVTKFIRDYKEEKGIEEESQA